jgi:hypothetical protein
MRTNLGHMCERCYAYGHPSVTYEMNSRHMLTTWRYMMDRVIHLLGLGFEEGAAGELFIFIIKNYINNLNFKLSYNFII